MIPKLIMIATNSSWNIYNFRSGLIAALIKHGYNVIAVAPPDRYSSRVADLGCRFIPIPMDQGLSPTWDMVLLARLVNLLHEERPDAFLAYTIKLNIYGSIAANLLGIPILNNISGLGTAFIRKTLLTRAVVQLYRLALMRSHVVFFQNEDDRAMFVAQRLVRRERTILLPGSGVNLSVFKPASRRMRTTEETRFIFIGRLLRDKGVVEFVDAARFVRKDYPKARFQLLGFLDVRNRTAIDSETVETWVSEGAIEYLGETDDVRPFIEQADCVVLPSYREGTPRSLLEAGAMAKPLIATDVAGCRNVVVDGENGFLCEVKSAEDLALKICKFLRLAPSEREAMGEASLRKIATEFDERFVIGQYLERLEGLFWNRETVVIGS